MGSKKPAKSWVIQKVEIVGGSGEVLFVCILIMSKTSSKKTSETTTTTNPRNTFVAAMMGRYGKTTTTMGDRRKIRGGQRNRQRDYMSGDYLLYNETEEEEQMKTNYDRVSFALTQLARVYSETFEGATDFSSLDYEKDRGEHPWKASIDSGSSAIEGYGESMEEAVIILCIEVLRGPWSSDRKYRAIRDAVQKLLLECTY